MSSVVSLRGYLSGRPSDTRPGGGSPQASSSFSANPFSQVTAGIPQALSYAVSYGMGRDPFRVPTNEANLHRRGEPP